MGFKIAAIEIFRRAGFVLHKWHSNRPELEDDVKRESGELTTYAKEQLGTNQSGHAKILGLAWNKEEDILEVQIPDTQVVYTKRGVLQYISSIYDPLGVICPVTLLGKEIYRQICESKLSWDEQLSGDILNCFKDFCKNTTFCAFSSFYSFIL